MIDPSTSKDMFGTSEDSEEFNGFSKEEIKMASSQKSRRLRQKAKETSSISVRSEIQRPSFLIGGAEDQPKLQSVSLQQIAKQKRIQNRRILSQLQLRENRLVNPIWRIWMSKQR